MDVNVLVRAVQVSRQHHWLFGSKLLQVLGKVDVPLLQSVVQSLQAIT